MIRVQRANEHTDAEDSLMLIYTSERPADQRVTRTGFPIAVAQDMLHCFDVQPGETMLGQRHRLDDGPVGDIRMTLLGGTFVICDGA